MVIYNYNIRVKDFKFLLLIFFYINIEALANHNESMFHLTRVTEEKKSLQRSLNEYIKNHCNCDKVICTFFFAVFGILSEK